MIRLASGSHLEQGSLLVVHLSPSWAQCTTASVWTLAMNIHASSLMQLVFSIKELQAFMVERTALLRGFAANI